MVAQRLPAELNKTMSAIERLGMKARPVEVPGEASRAQSQTERAFSFKWARRSTYESEAVKAATKNWLFERYCDSSRELLSSWLRQGPQIILDAGCGSGHSALLFFGEHLKRHDYLGVDISDSVDVARQRFKEAGLPGDFLKVNLLDLPLEDGSVDMIFSEGVLHHTDSVEKSIKKLARFLRAGGRFLFYVYAKKAPLREFTDDYVRGQLQPLSDDQAWKALEPLTKLGKVLGELGTEIEIPEDIPLLGMKKGRFDLQRFFYWNICKAFYRSDYTFEEMNHVNFDWFRPLNCHRHTPEEIAQWCQQANLHTERMDIQESGITVVATKSTDTKGIA